MVTDLYANIHASRHSGRVAIVTGGSTGIGLATAKRLVREGATVYVAGRRKAELDRAVSEIGPRAHAIQGDISSGDDLHKIARSVTEAHGRVDILFANAGGGSTAPLGTISEADFYKYFDINVKGTLLTVQSVLPFMIAGSAIVVTGSIASIKGIASFGVYAATKAALRSFARTWASDLMGRNIRINVVSPGVIVTPVFKTELNMSDDQVEAYLKKVAETTPLGRAGEPDEVAKAVSFLASEEASYITGIELFVDGGRAQV
jgi:NAD(P)-dependent dehydrogenase (short-subunit alcohol dehydrogenase family)